MAKYIFKEKLGIVWDADENKPLARFQKGVFETEDGKVASKLKKLGYEPAEVVKDTKDETDKGGNADGNAS